MNFTKQLEFLSALSVNNNREWFLNEQNTYLECRKQFTEFISRLIAGIGSFDNTVAGLETKNCIFRINRDLRFSKDKTPYKTNFSAYLANGGKKSPKAGYYFHLEPGKSFIAGGIWMPAGDTLLKIRQEIDYNQEEFNELIHSDTFIRYFGSLDGERLKSAPRGYSSDHPLVDILRLKSFLMTAKLPDKKLQDVKEKELFELFEAMSPVNQFINRVFDDYELSE